MLSSSKILINIDIGMLYQERAKVMMKLADLIDENIEELAAFDAIDAGKLYYINKAVEIPTSANELRRCC